MKIVVIGLGYVGLSNAVLLSQHNEVIGVDISRERVDMVNARQSPIIDAELSKYLLEKNLNLYASTDLKASLPGADFVIVSTPTNYDENTSSFDTSSVEDVIGTVTEMEPNACIVVKSTVPVGFIDGVRDRLDNDAVFFSPEFLREGKALYDNLYPSRIVVGQRSERAKTFASLLLQGCLKTDVDILFVGAREAEAIKLFANTYLAMRVAFFNELDSYALENEMQTLEIINGVSLDPRIGNHYNNPSFGYGGYCLPKDTKQLLANYANISQNIITAVVRSNQTRQELLAQRVMSAKPRTVGIFKLSMKANSDNYRQSSTLGVIEQLQNYDVDIVVYEPSLQEEDLLSVRRETDLSVFLSVCDVIVANRFSTELEPVRDKVFSRDLFFRD